MALSWTMTAWQSGGRCATSPAWPGLMAHGGNREDTAADAGNLNSRPTRLLGQLAGQNFSAAGSLIWDWSTDLFRQRGVHLAASALGLHGDDGTWRAVAMQAAARMALAR